MGIKILLLIIPILLGYKLYRFEKNYWRKKVRDFQLSLITNHNILKIDDLVISLKSDYRYVTDYKKINVTLLDIIDRSPTLLLLDTYIASRNYTYPEKQCLINFIKAYKPEEVINDDLYWNTNDTESRWEFLIMLEKEAYKFKKKNG